jgi:hypothetical protein
VDKGYRVKKYKKASPAKPRRKKEEVKE